MKQIHILGPGCPKCKKLAEAVEAAAKETGQPYTLTKVSDIAEIMAFGVMTTPALVVDGQVKSAGRIPAPAELKALIG